MEQEQEAREELRGCFWKENFFKAVSGYGSPDKPALAFSLAGWFS